MAGEGLNRRVLVQIDPQSDKLGSLSRLPLNPCSSDFVWLAEGEATATNNPMSATTRYFILLDEQLTETGVMIPQTDTSTASFAGNYA
jgi:acetaldehyde dehydrogenase (acetylating)